MNDSDLVHYTSQALLLVLYLSLPVIVIAAVVGLGVGLFQALTQIQDQTFSFVFKLIAVILTIVICAQWVGSELHGFAVNMFNLITTVPP